MSELSAIQDGLDQGEFFLEYLPICSLTSNRCLGAEALIRWRRGSTVLLPGAFLPQVDNTPLAGFLTYWVIETVGRELGGGRRVRHHPGGLAGRRAPAGPGSDGAGHPRQAGDPGAPLGGALWDTRRLG